MEYIILFTIAIPLAYYMSRFSIKLLDRWVAKAIRKKTKK